MWLVRDAQGDDLEGGVAKLCEGRLLFLIKGCCGEQKYMFLFLPSFLASPLSISVHWNNCSPLVILEITSCGLLTPNVASSEFNWLLWVSGSSFYTSTFSAWIVNFHKPSDIHSFEHARLDMCTCHGQKWLMNVVSKVLHLLSAITTSHSHTTYRPRNTQVTAQFFFIL